MKTIEEIKARLEEQKHVISDCSFLGSTRAAAVTDTLEWVLGTQQHWYKERQDAIDNIVRLADEYSTAHPCECLPETSLCCWRCLMKHHVDAKKECDRLIKEANEPEKNG